MTGVRQRIIGTALYYLGDERCRAKPETRNEKAIMHELFEYVTITRLGEMFGVTRIKMGHRLVEIGLREWNYKEYCPTPLAMTTGYCKATESDQGIRFYVWHRKKTVKALEAAGYEQIPSKPVPTNIGGPFYSEASGEGGFKIVGGDGSAAIWVLGEDNARLVVAALNKEFGFSSGA